MTLKEITSPQMNVWTLSTVVTREDRILGFEEVPSSSPGCHQCGNAVHIWEEEMLTL